MSTDQQLKSNSDSLVSVEREETKDKRKWYSYIWDTFDKSPEERQFLTRLDACLLAYASLSYFSKNLDQSNITNAYVSGMKEELGLLGNELNYIQTAWTCGYVIGQIPSNLIITRIRPSIWIPTMELIWSVLTMILSTSKGFKSIIAIRFFIGLAEATFYPAMQYVIGSWYKPDELAKRACIFHAAGSIGVIFSGFLQAAAYEGLNGTRGMAGWRWLFIIDGFITVPIAVLGFWMMPDTPDMAKPSMVYNAKQLELGKQRMRDIGRKPAAPFTKKKVLGFFSTWHFYVLVPLYILFNNSGNSYQSMIYWLKYRKYTVSQINLIPIGQSVTIILTTLGYAWWSDAIRKRWPPIILAGTLATIASIGLASTSIDTDIPRRWFFYYLAATQSGLSGIILAWANELTSEDNEKRSFIVASSNTFAYVFQAWLPIVAFPQVEQPRVLRGNIANACILVLMMAFALLTLFFQTWDEKRAKKAGKTDASIEAQDTPSEVEKEDVVLDATPVLRTV